MSNQILEKISYKINTLGLRHGWIVLGSLNLQVNDKRLQVIHGFEQLYSSIVRLTLNDLGKWYTDPTLETVPSWRQNHLAPPCRPVGLVPWRNSVMDRFRASSRSGLVTSARCYPGHSSINYSPLRQPWQWSIQLPTGSVSLPILWRSVGFASLPLCSLLMTSYSPGGRFKC